MITHAVLCAGLLLLAAEAAPQEAAPAKDAVPSGVRERYQVVGVAAEDTLNLRKAPDATAPVLAKIPADANGLVSTGETQRQGNTLWRVLAYGGHRGWVNARFLKREENSPQSWRAEDAFFENLSCIGDQPLWWIKIDRDGAATVTGDGLCEKRPDLRAKRAQPGRRPGAWLLELFDAQGRPCVSVQIRRTGKCTNEAQQPEDYEFVGTTPEGTSSKGCCNPLRAPPTPTP